MLPASALLFRGYPYGLFLVYVVTPTHLPLGHSFGFREPLFFNRSKIRQYPQLYLYGTCFIKHHRKK